MTTRTRPATLMFALTLLMTGCFGTSEDKGDNSSSKLITPKPSTVEDANTAGTRKTVLPEPGKPDVKAGEGSEAAPK